MTGGGQQQFNANAIKKIKVPVLPLKIQKQLVTEAEREGEIAAANHRLIELYEQKIADVISAI